LETLGEGAYGKVYKAIDKKNNQVSAAIFISQIFFLSRLAFL
jgi:serine/threonine protein kinase